MALALRPLQLIDVAAVTRLGETCGIHWPSDHLESLIARPQAFCRVAEQAGCIVGALTAHIWPEETELLDMAVHVNFRRQRIARSLLTELFTAAAAKRSPRVVCEVAVDNHPAQRLYEALDFVEIAVRPAYFRSKKDSGQQIAPAATDAKLMERRLAFARRRA